ncbi:MAG: CDF family Co(II)/Ni(II) efflux transporter DmeF [Rhodospirillales bacterium]|nr:CDF family Co(II)/Ni(II) efflux transporter DmeF [Rhodospirillales bacterium]
MHTRSLDRWQHDHAFGQQHQRAGERRTLAVAMLTTVTMVIEIVAGLAFGSMALLADGLHMASHAAALGLSVIAYVYVRKHANDRTYTFGTGKINALAGYSSAIMLALFALAMAVESGLRLLNPQPIAFDQAILVAILGLAVNAASLLMLRDADGHLHGHSHGHGEHGHEEHQHAHQKGYHQHAGEYDHAQDHNLRGAYLHVLADALTSLLAIAALVAGKVLGWSWADALVGLLGAVLVSRWAAGLVRESSAVLLDREAPVSVREQLREALETKDDRIADLHVWSVGPQGYAAALSVVSHAPATVETYRAMIPAAARIVHATIEVHYCQD